MEKSFQNVTWPGWETVDILGYGNFGAVYKIQRVTRGRTEYAALKVIRIPKEESEIAKLRQDDYDDESITQYYADCLNKIEDEYAMMAELKGYANIVYCDDYFSQPHEDGFGWDIYIKMELLTPLKAYLPTEIPEAQVVSLGIDICNALKRCEELNIVHRDIKPENIFVSKEGKYKLGDFGIARTMEGTTGGTKTGTFDYMAPEVNNSKAYHTEVDIYSLGLVMYWMLNERIGPFLPLGGKKPTPSMKQMAWDRRFAGEQIPAPKNGSEELKAIVLKACAYDPKERYQSAKEMQQALETACTGNISTSVPESVTPETPMKESTVDDELTVGPNWSHKVEEPVEDDNATVGPDWHRTSILEDNDVTVGPVFREKKKNTKAGRSCKQKKEAKYVSQKRPWIFVACIVCLAIIALILFPKTNQDITIDQPLLSTEMENLQIQQTTEDINSTLVTVENTEAQSMTPTLDSEPDHEQQPSTTKKCLKVGIAMPTKDLQRWVRDGENMKFQLQTAGYEVDLQYAANDITKQISQLQNMIANGCEVLVIACIDGGESLGTVLAEAKTANIPVIAYDRLIMNSDAVTCYATFDNWDAGVRQGVYIRDALDLDNQTGPFNIEFITGDPNDNNINFFFDGAISILQPYIDSGKLVALSGQYDKKTVATQWWDTSEAQTRFENILCQYYVDAPLHAVLASNDTIALGVANALESCYSNNVYPILTGMDCNISNIYNLINGKQSMSVFYDTSTLASKVVEMVDTLMNDQELPINDAETYDNGTGVIPSFLCEPVVVTIDNYKEVLVGSGYYTNDELPN